MAEGEEALVERAKVILDGMMPTMAGFPGRVARDRIVKAMVALVHQTRRDLHRELFLERARISAERARLVSRYATLRDFTPDLGALAPAAAPNLERLDGQLARIGAVLAMTRR